MDENRCEGAEHREPTAPSVEGLIARLEAAERGDGELSWAIAEHLGWARIWCGQTVFIGPGEWADKARRNPMSVSVVDLPGDIEAGSDFPHYTTSLDAALTLRPEGAEYTISTLYGIADVELPLNGETPEVVRRKDGNVILATCIAGLKARQAAPLTGRVELGERPNTESSPTTASATRWQATLEAETAAILDFVVDGKIGDDPSPPAVVDYTAPSYNDFDPIFGPGSVPLKSAAVVDYTERAQPLVEKYADYLPTGALEQQFGDDVRAALSAVASEHKAEIAAAKDYAMEADTRSAGYLLDMEEAKAALLARLREPEMREALVYGLCPILRACDECDMPQIINGPHPECRKCKPHAEIRGGTAGCRMIADIVADAALAVITEKLT